jgi:hypothetical protein
MSLDLTGGLLVSFLLDELRPVFARHPRYRDNAGETFQTYANLIQFRDVSVTVGNLRGDGARMSPDYYMATQWARALYVQVNGKPGTFIEWMQEIDPTLQTPVAGMYLLAVDQIDPKSRAVRFITTSVRTLTGSVKNADGCVIAVDPAIPLALVQPTDPSVQLERAGTKMWLTQYVAALTLIRTDTGATLAPGVDWWLERTVTLPLGTTVGGAEYFALPAELVNLRLLNGSTPLVSSWVITGDGRILLATATAPGLVLSATGLMRVDPRTSPLIHPENLLPVTLNPNETLTASSIAYWTPGGGYTTADTVTVDGAIYIKDLLTPGDDLYWEACTGNPQVYVTANKMELTTALIPGLRIAIGDMVDVGDQACVLVSPSATEVYKIYGGKDTISFDLTIKTNDLATSSELATLARSFLVAKGRNRMESAGVTIHTVSYAYQGGERDASGTAVSHAVTLSVTAQADWEFLEPIVSSIGAIGLDLEIVPGQVAAVASSAGRSQFVTSYF